MRLFEPILIGSMELKNRIVMPPMVTNFASETGAVTERLVEYHVERAKGMVGLIIVEATCVESILGRLVVNQLRVDSDKFLPGLADLVEAIHLHGAKVALQLHHAGRQTTLEATEGRTPVSASDIPCIDMYDSLGAVGVQPRPLTVEEIGELVEKFGEGARRAKAAGFDAVELHGAHGYLIAQFLSPYSNKRTDMYGGSFEGRLQFALEVIGGVREKVGWDYPLSFRISADEFIDGGITLELAKRIAVKLEEAGVDVVHVSATLHESAHMCEAPMAVPRGYLVHLAEDVKSVVDVPVITVGRINDPLFAEKILQEGKADLVSMGRALIADPELPLKTVKGRLDQVRKCIACNICNSRVDAGLPIRCSLNSEVGREEEYKVTRAEKMKTVLVAGGGLAGMETARVAALRGHRVTLYEKTSKLGGQLILAVRPPCKEELQNTLDYLRVQMSKSDVSIRLRRKVTPELVQGEKPDAVVIATGAVPYVPRVSGIESIRVATAWDVLAGKVSLKDDIIVVGGGEVGCETAEYLYEQGKHVTLVEMLGDLALDMERYNRHLLLQRLEEKKVEVLTGTSFEGIVNEGIIVSNVHGKHVLKAGQIVLALGAQPTRELAEPLKGIVKEVYIVGDCVRPRGILEAIHEGSWVARQI